MADEFFPLSPHKVKRLTEKAQPRRLRREPRSGTEPRPGVWLRAWFGDGSVIETLLSTRRPVQLGRYPAPNPESPTNIRGSVYPMSPSSFSGSAVSVEPNHLVTAEPAFRSAFENARRQNPAQTRAMS